MPCYKPLIRVEDTWKWTTAEDGHLYHPAKIISENNLEKYDNQQSWKNRYKYTQINCKECIGCRLDYSRDWANRGYLESLMSEGKNYFVTLTYRDVEIPDEITTKNGNTYCESDSEEEWKGTLNKKDGQKFIKALRQEMKRKYGVDGIRFMLAGEYGTEDERPHIHVILFNCPLPPETFKVHRVDWKKQTIYRNQIIEKTWTHGYSEIAEANWNTIAYVARYITKKQNGPQSEEEYAKKGQIKEFFITSRNPGIGKKYYDLHKDEIYKYDKVLIKNNKGSYWIKPPTYYDHFYEKEHPEEFEELKRKRKKEIIDSLKVKGTTTSLTRWEQLQIEMSTKEEKAKTLKRLLTTPTESK